MKRLTILGGSTPFTAALVDALGQRAKYLPPHELILHGRNKHHLAIMARYADLQLRSHDWQIAQSTNLCFALEAADVVVHQVRYGGMEARARAEGVSLAFGITPDETLGPGALYSALQLVRQLDETSAAIVLQCPNAWVLNLTNPLSLTTGRMIRQGVVRCVGLCELPRITYRSAAAILGKNPQEGLWSYVGLNHRGFIVQLAWNGKDYISELVSSLDDDTIGGVDAREISELEAIPTKYFRLYSRKSPPMTTGRSAFLTELRQRILVELIENPHCSPISLKQRYMAWYEHSVVPMIEALSTDRPSLIEMNQMTVTGLVEEGRAWVSKLGVEPFLRVSPSRGVSFWMNRLREHEHCMTSAVDDPNFDSIARALEADPMVRADQVRDCARHIWNKLGGVERDQP